jgi:peptide/nickel transport system permease protein
LIRYLIRRVLFGIVVLWVVSILTFFIFLKLPAGNPAQRAAGKTTTAKIVHEAELALGLDRPWYVQYGRFAKGLIPWPGFFLNKQVYYSWDDFVPVKEIIYSRLPVTITVAIGAAVVWLIIGIPTGIVSAIRRRSVADRAAMIGALLGISLPDFWLAYVFLYIFWFKLGILPGSGIPTGMNTFQAIAHGSFVLPWVVLASTFAGFYTRMVRGNLLESMTEDYVRTARAKGLSERTVIFKHAMRAALTPVVTMFGMDLGLLLGGAVIAETVFNLPGIGQYTVQALRRNDFPAVMTVTVFSAFFIVVMNLIIDVGYAFLDPRVRYT